MPEVGGLLIPVCETFDAELKKTIRKNISQLFSDLSFYTSNIQEFMFFHSNIDFSQIDLEVSDKNKFLQKLMYFANTYFPKKGFRIQRIVVKWDKEFDKYQNISERTSHLER